MVDPFHNIGARPRKVVHPLHAQQLGEKASKEINKKKEFSREIKELSVTPEAL